MFVNLFQRNMHQRFYTRSTRTIYVNSLLFIVVLTPTLHRPKLFGIWGSLIPIGKAASALFSSFLDSRNSSVSTGSYMTNVTVDPVSDTRHDVATVDGSRDCVQDTIDSNEEKTYKPGESKHYLVTYGYLYTLLTFYVSHV